MPSTVEKDQQTPGVAADGTRGRAAERKRAQGTNGRAVEDDGADVGGSVYFELAPTKRGEGESVDSLHSGYEAIWSLEPLLELGGVSARDRAWLAQIETAFSTCAEDNLRAPAAERDFSCPIVDAKTARRLVRFFFPVANPVSRLGGLSRPLDPTHLLATPAWQRLSEAGSVRVTDDRGTLPTAVVAGMLILNQCYGQELVVSHRRVVEARSAEDGLTTFYSLQPSFDYVRVEVVGEKPALTENDIRKLLGEPDNKDFWHQLLPPANFRFRGVQALQATDQTSEISLVKLQTLLMKRESVLSERRLGQMQAVMRDYLSVPDLRLGILALDYPRRRAVRHSQLIRQDILCDDVDDILSPEYGDTIYYEACEEGKTKIYDDLRDCRADNGPLDEMLLEKGYRSLVLVPLLGRARRVIGMIELASAQPYAFHNLVLYRVDALVPLFRQAMRRSRDEMEARVQRVMRQTFTALDPSVEWRFIDAAAEIIEREQSDDDAGQSALPDIRFEDVWALYAQADIVSSSKLRNEAIREDLIVELTVAEQLLNDEKVKRIYPLAGKLCYDIQDLRELLDEAMSPTDEQQVQDFLDYNFAPMLEQLRGIPSLSGAVARYLTTLAAARPSGRTKREGYEQSVRAVTGLVTRVISKAQVRAQQMIPHYFSKYRTDGVEYNIYAGQSLLQEGKFSMVHLQNLRLWQLQTMVDVTRAVAKLESRLPTPMLTAQLIFAFGSQITIQFRMDEKRFDVEGAYNVRYEIIKKRIDKALVRGTEERLTLANHIAIVYSHHSDADNYREMLKYLHGSGQVAGDVEEVELEPMQGVDGLSALRVRVL